MRGFPSLPDGATPQEHIQMGRMLARTTLIGVLGIIALVVLVVLVLYLPSDPNAALTALLGSVAGGIITALAGLANSLAQAGKEEEA